MIATARFRLYCSFGFAVAGAQDFSVSASLVAIAAFLVGALLATGAMFSGAAVGAFLVFHMGVGAVLALTFTLLGLNAIAAYRVWSRSAA
jgi:hypothetical protein